MAVKDPRTQNIRPITARKVIASNTPQIPMGRTAVDTGAEMLKGILSPLYTMIARPAQAGAALAGVDIEKIDRFSEKYTGGLIAPTPKNVSDLKKDIGRAVETIALGIPSNAIAGKAGKAIIGTQKLTKANVLNAKILSNVIADTVAGAIFGAGYGLEQGQKLKEVGEETLKGATVGAVGGQVLRGIGRALGKKPVAPQYADEIIPEQKIPTATTPTKIQPIKKTKPLVLNQEETRTIQRKLIEEEPKFAEDPVFKSGTFEKFKNDYQILREQTSTDDLIDISLGKKPNPTTSPNTAIYELLKREKGLTYEQKRRLTNKLPESKAGQELGAVRLRDNGIIYNNDIDLAQAIETKLKDKALKQNTRKTLGRFLDDLECK